MIIMGIDPSVRSTGVCVWDTEHDNYAYYLVVKNSTKKLLNFKHPLLHIHHYEEESLKDLNAIQKEIAKTKAVNKILNVCGAIMDVFSPDYIVLEAIAMHGSGKLDQLSGINYGIRKLALDKNIKFYPVSPTSNKMEFVGNGGATKDMMVDAWKGLRPEVSEFEIGKHIEDLADAYSLVHYPILKYINQ